MAQPLGVQIIDTLPKLNFAVFGEGGVGKTTLLAGFAADPRLSPALWLNYMGNPELLLLQNKIAYGIQLNEWQDLREPLMFIINGQSGYDPIRKKWGWPKDLVFRSLILDTFTAEQQALVNYVVEKKPAANRQMPDVRKVDATMHGGEIAATTMGLIHQILASPIHTFLSYQEYEKLDFSASDDGKVQSVKSKAQLHLYGQSRQLVPPLHNLMCNLRLVDKVVKNKVEKTLVAYWRDANSVGKNQVAPSLAEHLDDPTAAKILDIIEQDWAEFISNQSSNQDKGAQ